MVSHGTEPEGKHGTNQQAGKHLQQQQQKQMVSHCMALNQKHGTHQQAGKHLQGAGYNSSSRGRHLQLSVTAVIALNQQQTRNIRRS
jgi:hypothetical protein